MKFKIVFSILFVYQLAFCQTISDSITLNFHYKFGNERLELNKNYISSKKDTLQINLLKFYISNIRIEYSDKSTYSQPKSYHLVDIEDLNSNRIPLALNNKKTISKIKFNIGIDSLMSVSGALDGDLDASKGMYWAWQSGYINMKIEGKSSSCKTRKNQFNFHIGGYLKPNYAIREIVLESKNSNSKIDISVDLNAIFSEINLSELNSVMIPGEKAMKLADYSIQMFEIE